jgi:hypothetical protein
LAEGLSHWFLVPLPNLDGPVPDALDRPHFDWAPASDHIPSENQRRCLWLRPALRR